MTIPAAETLRDLISKLEAATGPSRELDAAIVLALYPEASIRLYIEGDTEPTVFHAAPLVPNKHELPHYTASIDAALTLVPEGYFWSCGHNPDPDDDTPSDYGAMLCRYWHVSDRSDTSAVGATPALALCIAACKAQLARAAKEG